MIQLDNLDRRILIQLQQNNRVTNTALAEHVGLSAPACLKRVKQLRQQGYIERDVSILNAKLVGLNMTVILEVEMERDRPELYQRFSSALKQAKEVTQCYQVSGEIDYVIIITVPDYDAFRAFVERVIHPETNIRKFRTLVSHNREIFTTEIPLGE